MSSPNPLLEMEVAVTRVDPRERDAEPFLPDQRLTIAQAFAAFTMGSAIVNHDETRPDPSRSASGRISRCSTEPCSRPTPGPLGDARVVMTIAAGRVVHEAD